MSATIMVVEDDPYIAQVLVTQLQQAGFGAVHYADGRDALDALQSGPLPALVLLDVGLPGLSGLDVLRKVRERDALPVLLLTGQIEEAQRVHGLEMGADDYICKPFSPREVVARVKTVLRRGKPLPAPVLRLDPDRLEAWLQGARIACTPKEFSLLQALAARPDCVVSRAQLLDKAYPRDLDVSERVLDSHIKNLRRKMDTAAPGREWIAAVYGVGFRLLLP